MKVSVVIPVFNEKATLETLVSRVIGALEAFRDAEVIFVDDGSTDGSAHFLMGLREERVIGNIQLKICLQGRNRGKGAALRRGFEEAVGEVVLIQDADLEYDPADYFRLVAPILEGRADAVYGSRLMKGRPPGMLLSSYLANRFLTGLSNVVNGMELTDMETCYKAIRRGHLHAVSLREERFGFEPEITGRLAALGARFVEVTINYRPRSRGEGKKINWKDGLSAIRCILTYRSGSHKV